MKVAKKVIQILITIILVVLLVYNVYRFINSKVLKKDITTINGYTVLEVISGSMEPTIHIGDMIAIDTKVEEFSEGDIITFYDDEGSFVTHRIVSIDKNQIITKGDNNNTEDDPISIDKVVGKYVFKISKGQKVLSVLKKPFIAILILVNGILLCIFLSIDRHGNLILDDDEKEYKEFKDYLNKKDK